MKKPTIYPIQICIHSHETAGVLGAPISKYIKENNVPASVFFFGCSFLTQKCHYGTENWKIKKISFSVHFEWKICF